MKFSKKAALEAFIAQWRWIQALQQLPEDTTIIEKRWPGWKELRDKYGLDDFDLTAGTYSPACLYMLLQDEDCDCSLCIVPALRPLCLDGTPYERWREAVRERNLFLAAKYAGEIIKSAEKVLGKEGDV